MKNNLKGWLIGIIVTGKSLREYSAPKSPALRFFSAGQSVSIGPRERAIRSTAFS